MALGKAKQGESQRKGMPSPSTTRQLCNNHFLTHTALYRLSLPASDPVTKNRYERRGSKKEWNNIGRR